MKRLKIMEDAVRNDTVLYIQKAFDFPDNPGRCPSPELLKQFCTKPEENQEDIYLHIQACPRCIQKIMRWEEESTESLFPDSPHSPFPDPPKSPFPDPQRSIFPDSPIFSGSLDKIRFRFSRQKNFSHKTTVKPRTIAAGEAEGESLPTEVVFPEHFPNGEKIVLQFVPDSVAGGYSVRLQGEDYASKSLIDILVTYKDGREIVMEGEKFAADGHYFTQQEANAITDVELKCNF